MGACEVMFVSMQVLVCIHACAFTQAYVCVHVHKHMRVCMCTSICVCACAQAYACVHVHKHMRVCMRTSICVCACVYACISPVLYIAMHMSGDFGSAVRNFKRVFLYKLNHSADTQESH